MEERRLTGSEWQLLADCSAVSCYGLVMGACMQLLSTHVAGIHMGQHARGQHIARGS